MLPRCVLIERATEYDDLLVRHGTREAVRFFLDQRGLSLEVVEARHRLQRGFRALVLGAIPFDWRRASIRREELDRFLFEDDDIIVVLGPDGLVANVAKYLREQPVIGLNPQPGVNPGVLVPHSPTAAPDVLHDVAAGRARLQSRTMVSARVDDGQSLTALNEIFVGHVSHQSARYRLTLGQREERQSSSGLIVATGTGATGWAASLHLERRSSLVMPSPEQRRLAFFVREPWPSAATGTTLTEGSLSDDEQLVVRSELSDGGVVFGDGIETDRLTVGWGQRIDVGIADRVLHLVL